MKKVKVINSTVYMNAIMNKQPIIHGCSTVYKIIILKETSIESLNCLNRIDFIIN